MQNLKRRFSLVGVMVLALALAAMPAFATTPVSEANTAISNAASDAKSIVTTNIPVILGVVAAFVVLKYGRRLLARL